MCYLQLRPVAESLYHDTELKSPLLSDHCMSILVEALMRPSLYHLSTICDQEAVSNLLINAPHVERKLYLTAKFITSNTLN